MPGVLRVRLAVTIGALTCALVACGADEGDPGTSPTGVSGTGSESGSTTEPGSATGAGSSPGSGADPSTGPGAGTSCGPSASTTSPEGTNPPSGTAPGDPQTHTQNPAGNCVIDSGTPNTPVDP